MFVDVAADVGVLEVKLGEHIHELGFDLLDVFFPVCSMLFEDCVVEESVSLADFLAARGVILNKLAVEQLYFPGSAAQYFASRIFVIWVLPS